MAKQRAVFSLLLLLCVSSLASGAVITGPDIHMVNQEISVSSALSLDEKGITDLKNGMVKEFTFHIGLYRVWQNWPDEFVLGKKIVKTLAVDPIKKEYTATSFDGSTLVRKRFKDFDSMLRWALSISDVRLAHTNELQPAGYFARIVAESRLRTLPPVIGYLFFFVPEREFKVSKDSALVTIGEKR